MSGDYDAYDLWVRQVDRISLETCNRTGFDLMGYGMFYYWFQGVGPDEAVELASERRAETMAFYAEVGGCHA